MVKKLYAHEGSNSIVTVAQILLKWYDLHRRDLPWRRNPTPYSTLVSEIMLQQTRVEAVLPLYERFMRRFPSVQELAEASQDEVLTYWQGLGYYSRARRLHQAAQIIVTKHGGFVPSDRENLRSLPGIGDYTCGAILSMAFDQPAIAIDGNLLRIGARLFLVQEPINRSKARSHIQGEFEKLIPTERPGDFNQALMDLGSGICLPKNPRCHQCPISHHCRAYEEDATLTLPLKDAPKPPVPVQVTLYLVESTGAALLRKREFGDFLQGMWELPWYEISRQGSDISPKVAEEDDWLGTHFASKKPTGIYTMDYLFSHRRWLMTICHYEVADLFYTPREQDTAYLWQPLATIDEIALPTVFKKALQMRP